VKNSSSEELKQAYERKMEKLRELEAERALYLGRGESVPGSLRFRLEMTRVEAEELRLWGHRAHVEEIREAMGGSR
jgi:hypothetical protein